VEDVSMHVWRGAESYEVRCMYGAGGRKRDELYV